MAIADTAAELEAVAAQGYDAVDPDDLRDAFLANPIDRGEGPNGEEALTKHEKAVLLKALVQPEVTSVNPPPYSLEELNHRFTHIKPDATPEPIFPHPQI